MSRSADAVSECPSISQHGLVKCFLLLLLACLLACSTFMGRRV